MFKNNIKPLSGFILNNTNIKPLSGFITITNEPIKIDSSYRVYNYSQYDRILKKFVKMNMKYSILYKPREIRFRIA